MRPSWQFGCIRLRNSTRILHASLCHLVRELLLYHEARSLRASNLISLVASGIGLSIGIIKARRTYAVEAFLLLQIGLCVTMVSIMGERTRYSSRYMKTKKVRLVFKTLVITAGQLLNVYFWCIGLDKMLPTTCEAGTDEKAAMTQATYGFYVVRVKL